MQLLLTTPKAASELIKGHCLLLHKLTVANTMKTFTSCVHYVNVDKPGSKSHGMTGKAFFHSRLYAHTRADT